MAAVNNFTPINMDDIFFNTHNSPLDISDYNISDEAPLIECPPIVPTSTSHTNQVSFSPIPRSYLNHSSSRASNARSSREPVQQREDSRVAFRTKSDIEVLDDGFKWRKYGKKSVKNSPNPRNYYRCSTEGCRVKKRVERDSKEPSYVITTYDGIHNHSSPDVVYYATQDSESGRFVVSGCHHACTNYTNS